MLLGTFLLVLIFSAYCYLPYILARAVIGQIERVRMPDTNKFIDFLFASIPGAAFNGVAAIIVSVAGRNTIGEVDRNTLAALFDSSRTEGAVSRWVATADIVAPLLYLSVVCAVAVGWALLVAFWFVWVRNSTRPDGRVGSLMHTLVHLAGLAFAVPILAMLHSRYQQRPWTREGEIWIRTLDDQIIIGRSRAFDFSGDALAGVTVRAATRIRSVEDVARARASGDTHDAVREFTLYIPGAQIIRLLERARGVYKYYSDEEVLNLVAKAPQDHP